MVLNRRQGAHHLPMRTIPLLLPMLQLLDIRHSRFQ
jgi:hypothetical protein